MVGSLTGCPDCKPLLKHSTEDWRRACRSSARDRGPRNDLASVASENAVGAGQSLPFAPACTLGPRLYCVACTSPHPHVDNANPRLHPAPMPPQLGPRECRRTYYSALGRWGEVLVRPLLPEAGGTIVDVERWGPSAIERKLVALERQRAKLVPMLAMHRMSAARRARLRQQLANVDEIIQLMKRTGPH
jgi:hypothetical protein